MAPISAAVFGLLLWGSILGVGLVFCYVVSIVLRDAGWFGAGGT